VQFTNLLTAGLQMMQNLYHMQEEKVISLNIVNLVWVIEIQAPVVHIPNRFLS
jgi:hypothetical protein